MIKNLVDDIRRNHALEHGTVSIMLGKLGPSLRLVGRAVPDGFYIYGNVPTEELTTCAHEALGRFKRGEASLAVTPLCGTNIAVAGIFSALASALAIGKSPGFSKLPNAFSAAMLGVMLSQPAGRLVQQYATTRPDLDRTEITGVRRGAGGWVHKVQTRRTAP